MYIEVNGVKLYGTDEELLGFIDKMPNSDVNKDILSLLTPCQTRRYNALANHKGGAHYSVVAQELGDDPASVNTMLNMFVRELQIVERPGPRGVFRVKY